MKRLKARKWRRGVTLIELMIGATIALFLTAAAVTFVRHETRLMGVSQDRVDMIQGARAALDLIAEDIRSAGQGIGYDEAGNFQGLTLGAWPVAGPLFNDLGRSRRILLRDTTNKANLGNVWASEVVDIGVLYASGSYRTVNDWDPNGVLQFCGRDDDEDGFSDMGFEDPEDAIAILRTEDGLAAETVDLSDVAPVVPCSHGDCLFGCYSATWAPSNPQIFNSGTAYGPNYVGGELAGRVQRVWYFVIADAATGWGSLQRAEFQRALCPVLDRDCGGTVAEGVESLQMQVYQFQTPGGWVNVDAGPITDEGRIRVDVELVVRADGTDERQHDNIQLRLSNNCVPMPCGTRDYTERRVYRTSVEVRNSGFMTLR
jgi:hypothetical protein